MKTPFKLRSGNNTPFKMMGSSPLKTPGHGGSPGHVHPSWDQLKEMYGCPANVPSCKNIRGLSTKQQTDLIKSAEKEKSTKSTKPITTKKVVTKKSTTPTMGSSDIKPAEFVSLKTQDVKLTQPSIDLSVKKASTAAAKTAIMPSEKKKSKFSGIRGVNFDFRKTRSKGKRGSRIGHGWPRIRRTGYGKGITADW